MPAPYRRLGRIVKAHGTQGEVSVALRDGLSFAQLDGIDVWIVPPSASGATPRRITDVRRGPKGSLMRVSGVESVSDAHEVAGRWLIAEGAESVDAGGAADAMIDLEVHDSARGFIGTVTDVIVTGANDVLVVDGGPYGQVLVPVIDQVIRTVDESSGRLEITLLEGLIEEDDA